MILHYCVILCVIRDSLNNVNENLLTEQHLHNIVNNTPLELLYAKPKT